MSELNKFQTNRNEYVMIILDGKDIEIWLEQQTWHTGRERVPREVGDEYSMDSDGDASEWFQSS